MDEATIGSYFQIRSKRDNAWIGGGPGTKRGKWVTGKKIEAAVFAAGHKCSMRRHGFNVTVSRRTRSRGSLQPERLALILAF